MRINLSHLGILLLLTTTGCGGAGTGLGSPNPTESLVQAGQVKLHTLDLGGRGKPLVLLPGLGDNAWVWRDFGSQFTQTHRVYAVTPRGFGKSEQPEGGYDVDSRAEDLRHWLDAKGIAKATLAAHSISGTVITRFAAKYPQRVERLIFIDAGIDYGSLGTPASTQPASLEVFADPAPTPEDFASLTNLKTFFRSTLPVWSDALDRAFADNIVVQPDGTVFPKSLAQSGAVMEGASAYVSEFEKLKMPVLAFFAKPDDIWKIKPWVPSSLTPEQEAVAQAIVDGERQSVEYHASTFASRIPHATVIRVEGGTHYLFLQRPTELATEINKFLVK